MWCLEVIIAMNKKAAEKAKEKREKDAIDKTKVKMPRKEAV